MRFCALRRCCVTRRRNKWKTVESAEAVMSGSTSFHRSRDPCQPGNVLDNVRFTRLAGFLRPFLPPTTLDVSDCTSLPGSHRILRDRPILPQEMVYFRVFGSRSVPASVQVDAIAPAMVRQPLSRPLAA